MRFRYVLKTALGGLKAQKVRSALTILGIVIGVASIVIIMALGEGAQRLILDQVSGLGAETITIRPGEDNADITATLYAQSLTKDDVEALKRKESVPNIVSVSPSLIVTDPIKYRGEAYRATIMGGDAAFFAQVLNIDMAEGELYTVEDREQKSRSIVLGNEIKFDIFGNESAVGKYVQIKGQQFRVVGVFEETSAVGPFEIGQIAFIPDTTAQTYITGTNYYNEVIVRADSVQNVEKVVYDVTQTLRDQHQIAFDETSDFNVQTQESVMERINQIVNVFTAFLVAVVAISLVVGGIGIMNIMLVSVSERTKEIGLRKAVGARNKDILSQFLVEAMILTGMGGVVGVILGALVSFIAASVLARTIAEDWVFVFPIFGTVLGVGVSVIVGLVFGMYPASKASKKSPIEALRYE